MGCSELVIFQSFPQPNPLFWGSNLPNPNHLTWWPARGGWVDYRSDGLAAEADILHIPIYHQYIHKFILSFCFLWNKLFPYNFLHFLQDSLLLFPWITTKIEGYTIYVLIQDGLLIICVEEYLLISNYINYYFLSKHRAQTLSSGFGKWWCTYSDDTAKRGFQFEKGRLWLVIL